MENEILEEFISLDLDQMDIGIGDRLLILISLFSFMLYVLPLLNEGKNHLLMKKSEIFL